MQGIIFSNVHDSLMGPLTSDRTLASLPFGGRYRQIDFVLSNMSNSGIETVGVITKHHYQSLMDHLGSCGEWDLNRKNGGVYIMPPFSAGQTSVYSGKIDALRGSVKFIERAPGRYVVLSDSNVLCNIDYREVMKSHIASGADITIIANKEPIRKGVVHDLVLHMRDNKVSEVLTDAETGRNSVVGMGMYIIEKEILLELVSRLSQLGYSHFERSLIQQEFLKNQLSINAHIFHGVTLRNTTVPSYVENNLALLEDEIRHDLFKPTAPIYTKVRDEVPTFYGRGSQVDGCLIADGCSIYGNIAKSVLFRDVTIGAGCEIKNCIIMQGTVIEDNVTLENIIIDKDAVITKGTILRGATEAPLIIGKGNRV